MRTRHLLAPLLVLLLAGCVPTPESTPTVTPAPGEETPGAATPTPTPSATITPAAGAIPFDIACSDLVTPQQFYDYNPNFSLLNGFNPSAGTAAAATLEAKGTACRWVNQTSGETIDISVAHLNDSALASAKASAAAEGTPSVFGSEGYFSRSGGVGLAQSFDGSYWITAQSAAFSEPVDLGSLMDAAIQAVG